MSWRVIIGSRFGEDGHGHHFSIFTAVGVLIEKSFCRNIAG
jgi:hypothetical protein